MNRPIRMLSVFLIALAAFIASASVSEAKPKKAKNGIPLDISMIYFEYNSSANDLGVHVFLDGEDWKALKISNPKGRKIFEVEGRDAYSELGLTELFFEGAEPNLADVPLEDLLAMFPAGDYQIRGKTVDGENVSGTATLSHAIPAGPTAVTALLNGDSLVISWNAVTAPPIGFPNEPINIVGYQVIVGAFQITVPANVLSVTVSPEFVASLASGDHEFEVLAIEAGGNQTITEEVFSKP